MKDRSAGYGNLDDSFFFSLSFSTLIIPPLPTSIIPARKSADHFTKDSSYTVSHPFFAALKDLVIGFRQFNYKLFNYVPQYTCLWVYLTHSPWASWVYVSMSFLKLGNFSAVISSNNCSISFFLPSPGVLIMPILAHLMVS